MERENAGRAGICVPAQTWDELLAVSLGVGSPHASCPAALRLDLKVEPLSPGWQSDLSTQCVDPAVQPTAGTADPSFLFRAGQAGPAGRR